MISQNYISSYLTMKTTHKNPDSNVDGENNN